MRTILSLLFICAATGALAQENSGYLLPEFEQGVIRRIGASEYRGLLNYEPATGKILFIQDGQVMRLDNPEIVSTVTIGDRVLVRAGKSDFLEKIEIVKGRNLYVRWEGEVSTKQVSGATYGEAPSGTHTMSLGYGDGRRSTSYESARQIDIKKSYAVNIGGKYHNFKNLRGLVKIFKDQADPIQQYATENNTDFNNVGDVIRLLDHFGEILSYR